MQQGIEEVRRPVLIGDDGFTLRRLAEAGRSAWIMEVEPTMLVERKCWREKSESQWKKVYATIVYTAGGNLGGIIDSIVLELVTVICCTHST